MAGKKITKAPSGKSFKFTPSEPHGDLTHEWETHDGCGGTIVMSEGGFPTCNEASVFICTGCDWTSPSIIPTTKPTSKAQKPWHRKPIKKQHAHEDSPALVAAVCEEFQRRREICITEREKFPPSLLRKGRHDKGPLKGQPRYVANPKFTEKMRQHMHKFAFSPEDIRNELLARGMK